MLQKSRCPILVLNRSFRDISLKNCVLHACWLPFIEGRVSVLWRLFDVVKDID